MKPILQSVQFHYEVFRPLDKLHEEALLKSVHLTGMFQHGETTVHFETHLSPDEMRAFMAALSPVVARAQADIEVMIGSSP